MDVNLFSVSFRQWLQEADSTIEDCDGYLVFDEFINFYRKVAVRKELVSLIAKLSENKNVMAVPQLLTFLHTEQEMTDVSEDFCRKLILEYEPDDANKEKCQFGAEGFANFLVSSHSDIIDQHQLKNQPENMTKPLSNYFINSSHNTYLEGDQLTSQSSCVEYIKALKDGCRCVELDCWDGPTGEPIIHHGYTFTSKILFCDVIKVINQHAFTDNPYPVILSIENHCGLEQQRRMAEIMKEIFGDKLNVESDDVQTLPSPDLLKKKILIKCKKLSKSIDPNTMEGEVSTENSEEEYESEETSKNKDSLCLDTSKKEVASPRFKWPAIIRRSLRKNVLKSSLVKGEEGRSRSLDTSRSETLLPAARASSSIDVTSSKPHCSRRRKMSFAKSWTMRKRYNSSSKTSSNSPVNGEGEDQKSIRQRRVLSRHLSDLVVFTRSIEFPGFDAISEGFSVWSFSETKAHSLVSSRPMDMIKVNRSQMSRIYPRSIRVRSGNFNPVYYWNAGCQLVALNRQTKDKNMALNEALFQLNGGFGYVLKPSCLIKDNSFNPLALNHPNKEKVLRLSVQVISGQQLPKPPASVLGDRGEIIDPFVEVEILGVVSDSSKKVTSVIDDNGFNPIWNETFEFILYYPELAFVRFTVWDSDPIGRDFIGQRTIALKAIGPGYRHIRLTDQDFATIFVKVSKQYISVEAHKATKVSRVASKVQRKSSFLGFGDRKKSFNDSIKSDSSESSSVKRLVICNPSVITQNPTTREKSHDQDIKGSLYKKGIARPLNDVTETTNFLTKHQLDSPQRFRKLSSTCREKSSSFSKSFGCCSVSRRKKKEQKMTLIANSGAKLKPKRFSSYFSKFLGKKRSNRRYTDFSNEAIVEDIEKTPRKSPKKNKNKSCSSPYQPTIVLAKKNSFTDLLPHVDPVEDENSHKNKRIFSETLSSVDTSTPVKSKTQRVEDDHRKKLVKDLNKAFSLLQPKVTSQPSKSSNQIDQVVSEDLTSIKPAEIYSKLLATNQNTNMSTYIPKATKTDFNEKIHALSKKSRNKPRRTKSLTENFTSSQYLSKSSKHNVSMSTFKSNSSPKSMRGDLHFRFNTNIHHSVTDGQTIQINHKKEPLPSECKKSFSIPCNQTNKQPQRLKCTSLLDLTSKQYDNEEKTTVSKRIGYTCASPTKKRRQTNCTTSNDSTGSSSDLAKKIIELTSAPSESIFCPPKQTTNFRSRRPRSMVAPPIESEYVMLNPLPRMEPRETRQTNHRHSMHPKRLSLRNDPDWDQGSNLLDSQSKSLCSVKPHQICRLKDESTNYSQQNNANVYLSPGDRYRAEAVEVLSKLRRSLQDVNEESTNGNSFRQTSYNPINLQSMRSKSVEALTARSFREHSATNTEKIHHPCRSRTRARHIAKKYNMFSSNENILSTSDKPSYQRQVDDDMQGNGDYVYLSRRPPSCPNSQDRLRWSNASYPNRQPTKSSNVDSMYTDLSNCSNDGRFIVTSRSSDYYHLNLIVSNARSNPDGAEHRAPQTNQTLNNKRSSQNWMSSEPKIYYAIDV